MFGSRPCLYGVKALSLQRVGWHSQSSPLLYIVTSGPDYSAHFEGWCKRLDMEDLDSYEEELYIQRELEFVYIK